MSYTSLLAQTCDVVHYGQTGTDAYNTPVYGETGRDSGVPVRIQQTAAGENLDGRDAASASHRAFFLPGQAIDEFDVIEAGGQTFRVVGPPARWWGAGAEHHVEAILQTISDLDWTYP